MKTKKGKQEFGVFTYLLNNDECIDQDYFSDKDKAIRQAEIIIKNIDLNEFYVEVWQKENDYWGASGEPILKSDI